MDVCDLHFKDTPRPVENVSTSIVTGASQEVNCAGRVHHIDGSEADSRRFMAITDQAGRLQRDHPPLARTEAG